MKKIFQLSYLIVISTLSLVSLSSAHDTSDTADAENSLRGKVRDVLARFVSLVTDRPARLTVIHTCTSGEKKVDTITYVVSSAPNSIETLIREYPLINPNKVKAFESEIQDCYRGLTKQNSTGFKFPDEVHQLENEGGLLAKLLGRPTSTTYTHSFQLKFERVHPFIDPAVSAKNHQFFSE